MVQHLFEDAKTFYRHLGETHPTATADEYEARHMVYHDALAQMTQPKCQATPLGLKALIVI
jgi:hypothetical protein